jgi:hypothetical protein
MGVGYGVIFKNFKSKVLRVTGRLSLTPSLKTVSVSYPQWFSDLSNARLTYNSYKNSLIFSVSMPLYDSVKYSSAVSTIFL